MHDLEGVFRALDSKYKLQLIERVRLCVITDAVDFNSYSLTLPGETTAVDAVPSVAARVPQVGDLVRVALVGDSPIIVDVLGGPRLPVQADIATTATSTQTTYQTTPTTGGAGPSVTLDLVAGQPVLVTVYARITNTPGGSGHQSYLSWSVSGAETDAAVDANAVESQASLAEAGQKTSLYIPTVTGSHTIAAAYKTTSGDTASFVNRRIIVVP